MSRPRYKRVVCADGFSVSIQAHDGAYCEPRRDSHTAGYQSVELGYPNRPCIFINEYAEDSSRPTDTVYSYVPASVVRKMLLAHGGIVDGECPPLTR
jgi:hypothetical protein